jgi:hypothetical protein
MAQTMYAHMNKLKNVNFPEKILKRGKRQRLTNF